MIKHIFTLKQSLGNRHLYVWGTGQKSMWIVLRFALRCVKVSGFVSAVPRFVSETILGLPVISPSDLSSDENAVIVADDYTWQTELEKMRRCGEVLLYSDALELDRSLIGKQLYIYGTGQKAWSYIKLFENYGISIKGFLSSFNEPQSSIFGKPVYRFGCQALGDDPTIVVASIYVSEILYNIESSRFKGDVYINELTSYEDLMSTNTFAVLANAFLRKKEICICYDGSMARDLLIRCLSTYDIPVAEEVALYEDNEFGLPDIYHLADKNIDNRALLMHSFSDTERCKMAEAAVSIGFKDGYYQFASLAKDVYNQLRTSKTLDYEKDFKMGVSIDYSAVGGLAGWAVHGTETDKALRIMVLGGSTSSELYRPENWISRLNKTLLSKGIQNVIFNGAYEMDDAQKELSRMCRDIRYLAPDIVISMSGVNDLAPKNDKFDFLRDENTFDYWKRIQLYKKAIAESEGAIFLPFLQPINAAMPDASLEESLFFLFDAEMTGSSFEQNATSDDFYINLLKLFRHKKGKFIDFCHYSDEGHEEIAQKVCSAITDALR